MKKFVKKIFKLALYLAIFFLGSSVLVVIAYRWIPVYGTPLMAIRSWENRGDDKFSTKKTWVPIEKIAPNMVAAVIASEDNNFTTHRGFDWDAIDRAIEHNKKNKRKQGASTISQQVAKNVFLWPERSYTRKVLEVYFTFLIETFWSKERIVEVYLNVAELGNGIYGVEAAAQTYFKKSAAKLTRDEAAMFAAILPNPRKWNPTKPTSYLLKRQQQILRLMKLIGPISLSKPE